jgi:hypothetical protein
MYILECGDYSEFCRWNSDGTSFYIINLVDFEKSVLGSIFKTEKFASFQRKLYRWNFFKSHYANSSLKEGNSKERQNNHTYKHHQFCKGNWNQVRNIQCRKRTLSKKELENREAKKRVHEARIMNDGLDHGQMLPQKKADISSAACHGDDLNDRKTAFENMPKKGRKHCKEYKNEEQLLPLLANREDASTSSSTNISSTSGNNIGGGTLCRQPTSQ